MPLAPYWIPQALRESVRQELEEMLDHGIKLGFSKQDSDYRRLSKVDAQVDNQVAGSPYLTKVDLTKGVPVAEKNRHS